MDLNTITEVLRPTSADAVTKWEDGFAWLAGGTWLFSEPQINTNTLIDLETLKWPSSSFEGWIRDCSYLQNCRTRSVRRKNAIGLDGGSAFPQMLSLFPGVFQNLRRIRVDDASRRSVDEDRCKHKPHRRAVVRPRRRRDSLQLRHDLARRLRPPSCLADQTVAGSLRAEVLRRSSQSRCSTCLRVESALRHRWNLLEQTVRWSERSHSYVRAREAFGERVAVGSGSF